jgi:hypothetical protein
MDRKTILGKIEMKLQPPVWGPFFWHTIHITALAYPESPSYTHKKAAKEFYESLAHLVPCPVCREHYQQHLIKLPITPHLDRRADLFKWTVALHNEVNKMLGKPIVSELESLMFYRRIGARGTSPVINQEHLDEVDIRSMMKGGFIGAGIAIAGAAALWWTSKSEKL